MDKNGQGDASVQQAARDIGRRRVLRTMGAGLVAAPAILKGLRAEASVGGDVFSLGVASGEPDARSVVLWTRLAPDPLNGGGMGSRDVPVRWAIALDEGMANVVRSGIATARSASSTLC